MLIIPIVDLVYINDAARAFKQKNFMWYQNMLVGIDNTDYITFINLDTSKFSTWITQNCPMFNQRDISKLMKTITAEQYFEVDDSKYLSMIHTVNETATVQFNKRLELQIKHNLNTSLGIDSIMIATPEEDYTSKLEMLYKMNSTAGAVQYHIDDTHSITVFGNLLPLNKADKIYATIQDDPNNNMIFYVRYRVHKKAYDVYTYVKYLKLK